MPFDREPIKVNRILTKKPGIAGIPADIFSIAIGLDLILYLFLVQVFHLGWQVFIFAVIVVDGTWIILTLRGVWRFVGLAFKPPRYIRANIPYTPQLPPTPQPDAPSQTSQARLSPRRETRTSDSN
jgi:hypothetical protein